MLVCVVDFLWLFDLLQLVKLCLWILVFGLVLLFLSLFVNCDFGLPIGGFRL